MKAWHFDNGSLRGGREIVLGEKIVHVGDLKMCSEGLHSSKKLLDALCYATGPYVSRVHCGGRIIRAKDKMVCSERTHIWRIDVSNVLHRFARSCALDVARSNSSEEILRYLVSGEEKYRKAAVRAAFMLINKCGYAADHAILGALQTGATEAALRAVRSGSYSKVWEGAWGAAHSSGMYVARKIHNSRLTRMILEEHRRTTDE